MNIKEFREKGYLQEVNRRFFHPLGLALEITKDNDNEFISGVWDYREDVEGIYYNISKSDEARKRKFRNNKEFIDRELKIYYEKRKDILGFEIEPID
jgi:hypothetical protein